MGWKKYFRKARPNEDGVYSPMFRGRNRTTGEDSFAVNNYPNQLPESYVGCQNRIGNYQNWENCDQDSEINSALDILAEFSTQNSDQDKMCFKIDFKEPPTETETKIIKKQLQSWYYLNEFNKRAFRLFRNVLKYGDQVFIRDPETFKLFYVEMDNVIKVIVNESKGKKPEQYIIRNINPNFENLTVTQVTANNQYNVVPTGPGFLSNGGAGGGYNAANSPYSSNSRFSKGINEHAINADHILHLSLTEGLDANWPFGNSILELVFKVFKQKELLEDSIIIYRVTRAPERRVFKIDVGDMPQHLAMAFIEKVKNEIHQRRMPSGGAGGLQQDSAYQGQNVNMDFFLPQTSSGRGSTIEQLPGGCLEMSTKVPLLDGRTLTLTELTNEFKEGKENWVYSCNPKTGEVVSGIISWAGVTQESAQVMKLTLDNGEEIICTPDHKFPILGKGFVEANELKINDSLIPFNIRQEVIKKGKHSKYTQIYDNSSKQWKFVHREVAKNINLEEFLFDERFKDESKKLIHHKNFNRFDNSPSNLVRMNYIDHFKYHSSLGFTKENHAKGVAASVEKFRLMKENSPKEYEKFYQELSIKITESWENLTVNERNDRIATMKAGMEEYYSSCTKEEQEQKAIVSRKNVSKARDIWFENYYSNEELRNSIIDARVKYWKEHKEQLEDRNKKIGEAAKERYKNLEYKEMFGRDKKTVIDKHIFDYIHRLILMNQYISLNKIVNIINNDKEILSYFLDLNKSTRGYRAKGIITDSQIHRAVRDLGYKSWTHFVQDSKQYNHQIVKIEYLMEPIQVGTLTIDKDEKYHNFHTFALSSGIFTKNSNLNEIDDLRYFSNKMMRGLRIPSSYLPTGQEDSPSTLNDGRVGTALIQEFRFNQYCERLQKLICGPLDIEFKAYLKWTGIDIDSSMFQLCFNPPQNFAHYRQAELDSSKISTFTQLENYPYMSKRYLMKRYLGMTEEEINENQKLWREENQEIDTIEGEPSDLRNLGITSGGIDSDMQNFGGESGMEDLENGELGEEGMEGEETPEGTPEGANTPVSASGPAPAGING